MVNEGYLPSRFRSAEQQEFQHGEDFPDAHTLASSQGAALPVPPARPSLLPPRHSLLLAPELQACPSSEPPPSFLRALSGAATPTGHGRPGGSLEGKGSSWGSAAPCSESESPTPQRPPAPLEVRRQTSAQCGAAGTGLPSAVSGEQLSRRSLQASNCSRALPPCPQAVPPGRHPSAQPSLRSPVQPPERPLSGAGARGLAWLWGPTLCLAFPSLVVGSCLKHSILGLSSPFCSCWYF